MALNEQNPYSQSIFVWFEFMLATEQLTGAALKIHAILFHIKWVPSAKFYFLNFFVDIIWTIFTGPE
jgi:hypothetical protein